MSEPNMVARRARPDLLRRSGIGAHRHWLPSQQSLGLLLVCCVALPFAYLILAYAIVEDHRQRPDDVVSSTVHGWATPWLTDAMRLVTHLGGTVTINLIYVGLAAWLIGRHRWQAGWVVAGAGALSQLLVAILKGASHRARPDVFPAFIDASGFSFPSGHTFGATLAWGLVAALVTANLSGRVRLLPWAVWGTGVVLVGLSRVYLGAHYATDVLASMALGSAWLLGWLLVIGRLGRTSTPRPSGPTSTSRARAPR